MQNHSGSLVCSGSEKKLRTLKDLHDGFAMEPRLLFYIRRVYAIIFYWYEIL